MKKWIVGLALIVWSGSVCADMFQLSDIKVPLDVSRYGVQNLEDIDQKKQVYHYLISQYVNTNEIDKAIDIIEGLPQSLAPISRGLYQHLFNSIYSQSSAEYVVNVAKKLPLSVADFVIEVCFQEGINQDKLSDAHYFFEHVSSPIIKSRMAANLVRVRTSLNDMKKAREMFAFIQLPSYKEKATIDIAVLMVKNEDVSYLNDLLQSNIAFENRKNLLQRTVSIFAAKSEYQKAIAYANQIKDKTYIEETYLMMMQAMIDQGFSENALQLAQQLTEPLVKEQALYKLGMAFAENEQINALRETLSKLETSSLQQTLLADAALILGKRGDTEHSFEFFHQLSIPNQKECIAQLAFEYGLSHDFNFSLLTLQRIRNTEVLTIALARFADGLFESGHTDKVITVLNLMEQGEVTDRAVYSVWIATDNKEIHEQLSEVISQSCAIQYVAYQLEQSQPSSDYKTVLAILNRYTNQKTASPFLRGKIATLKAMTFMELGDSKQAKRYARLASTSFRRGNVTLSEPWLVRYINMQSKQGKLKAVLQSLKQYTPSYKVLMMMHHISLDDHPKTRKNQQKKLQSFAKQIR